MTLKAHKKPSIPWVLIGGFTVVLGVVAYVVMSVMSDDGPRKKAEVATVTLLKPPPVQIKEKPPEMIKPLEKKEEVMDVVQDNAPKGPDSDNTPAGDKLGVDAEGGAGSDSFGLVGKKGGRSLLAGGDGMGRISLLSKFAEYTQYVSAQIKKVIMKRLDDEGGIPKGKLQAIVRISVDSDGTITDFKIIGSSGNHRLDEAIRLSLPRIKIADPPPDGMPRTMSIKINSQG